jgi:hypothetical protein
VQDGAFFGRVDFFAREHSPGHALNVGLSSQIHQQTERASGDAVFREIEQKIAQRPRERPEPVG